MTSTKIAAFRRTVWDYYKKAGRHDLPWRKTRDPYKILVSEVMLQQTQVARVIPKYKAFLKEFPTARSLARARLADVLKAWSGLGYNRRAKYLHDAAKIVVEKHQGNFRKALERPLPGVGPYTRAAVRTFAYNEPHTFIETNIRTTLIHQFFPRAKSVSDSQLLALLSKANVGGRERKEARKWYWALMDYGSHLKQMGVRNNSKSKHYTKQSKFKGSLREVRGAVLKAVHADQNIECLPFPKKKIKTALASLKRDGLI